jgi:membrane-associated protease RseP (regulator of RpoE activity)
VRRCRWSVLIASVWLCSACAGPSTNLPLLAAEDVAAERRKQQIAQMQEYFAQLNRVDNVAFRIRTANRADCRDYVTAQIGLYAGTVRSLPRKYQSFSAEALNLSWTRATAISVADRSPAAEAGIRVGDQILAFNGERVPDTATAIWMGGFMRFNGERPVEVTLQRDGVEQNRTVYPVIACAIPINLVTASESNAGTDGKKIVIQSGMLRVTRTDSELAVIIGHELAHANLGHRDKKWHNALLGALGGAAVDGAFMLGGIYTGRTFSDHFEQVGALVYSVGFEREADYVGAYYAARAGYDIAGAENVWRAMGLEDPWSIAFASTHPSTPERFILMKRVAEEIADKKRRHLPLVPEQQVIQAYSEAPASLPPDNNY